MRPNLSLVICDDDPDELLFFQFALQRLMIDYDISYVASGEDLLAILAQTNQFPDMIFLDNAIPGKSGIACLPAILALCPPTTAVIMHSCAATLNDIQAAFRAGASRYMIKELHPTDFRSALRQLMGMHRDSLVARDWSNFCVKGKGMS